MKPKHKPEDIVYLKTDCDLLPRIVTAYKVTRNEIIYELSCGTMTSWHFDFEIIKSKDELKKTNEPGFGKQ